MAHYLVQVSYSKEGIGELLANPQDRAAAVRPVIEGMGGKLESFYFAFGEYDVIVVAELPDNATAAALAMAVGGSPGISSYKTTPLLTMEEAMQAMGKASGTGYRSPAGLAAEAPRKFRVSLGVGRGYPALSPGGSMASPGERSAPSPPSGRSRCLRGS